MQWLTGICPDEHLGTTCKNAKWQPVRTGNEKSLFKIKESLNYAQNDCIAHCVSFYRKLDHTVWYIDAHVDRHQNARWKQIMNYMANTKSMHSDKSYVDNYNEKLAEGLQEPTKRFKNLLLTALCTKTAMAETSKTSSAGMAIHFVVHWMQSTRCLFSPRHKCLLHDREPCKKR